MFVYAFQKGFFTIYSIGVIKYKPLGKLHIGNETLGENPCFFYDENGKLVLLRSRQAFIGGPYFTQPLSYDPHAPPNMNQWWVGHTAAWCDIHGMKNTSQNLIRCHMYMIWFFPERRVANDSFFDTYFIPWLQQLKSEGFYFQLEMWNDNGTGSSTYPYAYPSDNGMYFWWNREARDYSLLWNKTVQDDLIWIWNYTLTKLYQANVLDHLVLIEPICEYPYPSSMAMAVSATPFYHGKLFWNYAKSNVSQDSWHSWLRKKYDDNITKLKEAWNHGPEPWNYSGTENDSFESLLLSNHTGYGYGNPRYNDMLMWTHECMVNFTRYFYEQINTWWYGKNKVYIGWDAQDFGRYQHSPQGKNNPNYITRLDYSLVDFHRYSDVILKHYYSHPLTGDPPGTLDQYDRLGDFSLFYFTHLAAWARALKKPFIIDETGCSSGAWFSGTNGWSTWATQNYKIAWTNASVRIALTDGAAGLNQFYCQYSHCIWGNPNPAGNISYWEPYMKHQMEIYKSAEAWLDKLYYAPITIVLDYGSVYSGEPTYTHGDAALLKSVGITPKYLVLMDTNGILYPEIPEDTEIVIWATHGVAMYMPTATMLQKMNSVLSDGKKLILAGVCNGEWFSGYVDPPNYRLENFLNVSMFPLTSMTYGTDYGEDYNSTTIHISLYGTNIAIRRSLSWTSKVWWNVSKINAVWTINTTDGNYYSGWGHEPFVLQNQYIAWIKVSLATSNTWGQGSNEYNLYDANTGLVYRKILENWGYHHPFLSWDYPDNSYGHALTERAIAKLSSTKLIAVIGSHHFRAYTYTVKINLTSLCMDTSTDYSVYFPSNSTIKVLNAEQLIGGFQVNVPGNQTEVITIQTAR
jgi:hypothetical protein